MTSAPIVMPLRDCVCGVVAQSKHRTSPRCFHG